MSLSHKCHCHLKNVITTSKISLEEMSLSPKQDFFAIYTYLVKLIKSWQGSSGLKGLGTWSSILVHSV